MVGLTNLRQRNRHLLSFVRRLPSPVCAHAIGVPARCRAMGPKASGAKTTLPKLVPTPTNVGGGGKKQSEVKKLPALAGATPSPTKTETPTLTDAVGVTAELLSGAGAAAEAAAEAAATEAAAEAGAAVEAKLRGNGMVKLLYEMYSEDFPIVDGCISTALIDETYCLSDVMPGCMIHLSKHDSRARRAMEDDPNGNMSEIFIQEEPRGTTLVGLEKDQAYYVVIEQLAEQLKRDQLMQQRKVKTMEGFKDSNAPPALVKDDGRVLESCSCVYGNPCVDEYGCKDWGNRLAVAKKNGWKGF